jgi:hypothetical protein
MRPHHVPVRSATYWIFPEHATPEELQQLGLKRVSKKPRTDQEPTP